MSAILISTPYLGSAMLPGIAQADQQLTKLQTEVTTGQYANLGLQLGDQSGYELSLRNADDLLQTLSGGNALVGARLSASSDTLSAIEKTAQSTLASLALWTPGSSTTVDLATTGDNSLQSLITAGNSTYAGDHLFSGMNTAVAPLSSYSSTSASQTALLDAFQTQFGCTPSSSAAGAISASDLQGFLAGAFNNQFSGSNWTTNWSSASSSNVTTEISPGQTVATSTNTNAPGFQNLAQGYAMLSLLGDSSLSSAAKQTVVTTAISLITKGSNGILSSASDVGQAQNEVKQADDDMTNQMNLIKTQIGGLDTVNEEQVATQLNSLTTQIEAAYQVTAQLQKLTLAQYLPA